MKDALLVTVGKEKISLEGFDRQGKIIFQKALRNSSAGRILEVLDKINKCNKDKGICLFNFKSVTGRKPKKVVFKSDEGYSTAHRIVLVSLRALAWSGAIELSEL